MRKPFIVFSMLCRTSKAIGRSCMSWALRRLLQAKTYGVLVSSLMKSLVPTCKAQFKLATYIEKLSNMLKHTYKETMLNTPVTQPCEMGVSSSHKARNLARWIQMTEIGFLFLKSRRRTQQDGYINLLLVLHCLVSSLLLSQTSCASLLKSPQNPYHELYSSLQILSKIKST